jgi:hypothetical protein
MAVSFLFFFLFLSFILPSHPCGPARHAPPSRPPPSPTPPHSPPPPPSPTARALPSPADLAALWIPPLPSPPSHGGLRGGATRRGGRAEEAKHGSMRGDSGLHRGSSSGGGESGFGRQWRPGCVRRRRARPPADNLPAGGSSSPRRRRRPSPGGGGARLQGGRERELGAATVCGGDRPTPTEVRGEGAVGAPRTGVLSCMHQPVQPKSLS